MKKVINGKFYDTDKARQIGMDGGNGGTFRAWHEELYLKRTGEFFLYGEGGPQTQYAEYVSANSAYTNGSKIIPLSVEAARKWAEEHLNADEYEAIFGLPDEDAEPVALHMMLPAQLAAAGRQRAAADSVPLTTIVERALRAYLRV